MESKIKEVMHRLSYLLEILVGFLMLAALFAALGGLVYIINPSSLFADPTVFSKYSYWCGICKNALHTYYRLCN